MSNLSVKKLFLNINVLLILLDFGQNLFNPKCHSKIFLKN